MLRLLMLLSLRLVLGLCAVLVRVTAARLLLAVVKFTPDALMKALILATEPVSTKEAVPEPDTVTPEPEVAARVPAVTDKVRVSLATPLASESEIPVMGDAVFSITLILDGAATDGPACALTLSVVLLLPLSPVDGL